MALVWQAAETPLFWESRAISPNNPPPASMGSRHASDAHICMGANHSHTSNWIDKSKRIFRRILVVWTLSSKSDFQSVTLFLTCHKCHLRPSTSWLHLDDFFCAFLPMTHRDALHTPRCAPLASAGPSSISSHMKCILMFLSTQGGSTFSVCWRVSE